MFFFSKWKKKILVFLFMLSSFLTFFRSIYNVFTFFTSLGFQCKFIQRGSHFCNDDNSLFTDFYLFMFCVGKYNLFTLQVILNLKLNLPWTSLYIWWPTSFLILVCVYRVVDSIVEYISISFHFIYRASRWKKRRNNVLEIDFTVAYMLQCLILDEMRIKIAKESTTIGDRSGVFK